MELTPAQSATNPQPVVIDGPATLAGEGLQVDADFDTFLALLTAQLKNQDPLEPVDSTQFVAQLAQFSAVEQQVETNNALQDILAQLGGADIGGLASWLGADVKAPGPVFFDGSPVALTVTPTPEATVSTLVVRNAAGDIIARQSVGSADRNISWDGRTDGGGAAPEGLYSFTVDNAANGEALLTQQAVGFSKVEEVRIEEDAPVLVLQGGDSVPLDDVLAVR